MTTDALEAALDAAVPNTDTTPTGGHTHEGPGLQLRRVRVQDLHPDPNNPRDEVTEVAELAASIEQAGLLQPPIARRDGDRLVIVAGHRRLAAIKVLGWKDVDVVVRRDMPPDQVLVAMLAENQQRVMLDPVEEARAYNRLKVVHHLTDAAVAERVGRNQAYVSGRLALLALPADQQEEIRAGQRTLGYAIREGRVRQGKVRQRDKGAGWHLAANHPLARRAAARCVKLEHRRGTRLGGVACGQCWESVIRADETQQKHDHAARRGECPICGQQTAGPRTAPGAPGGPGEGQQA